MAEALGTASSIIAVVQISEQIISACYRYYKTAKDAKRDIIDVINIVGGLKTTLDNLRILAENTENSRLPLLNSTIDGSLKACKDALQKLAKKLGVDDAAGVEEGNVVVELGKKLVWPWKEKEVGKILEIIEKHKANFILALSGDTLRVSLTIEDGVAELSKSIQTLSLNSKNKDILEWLKSCDPSTNHDTARSKHEPTTGDWFLRSDAFIEWKEGRAASLWLHGIPGAGKTILCSTVVENVISFCDGSNHQYAYFYFDFNDSRKQTVDSMLRSIITQLCFRKKGLPGQVTKLHQKYDDGNRQPTKKSLIDTVLSLVATSGRCTYVVLDALDECCEWEELLDAIGQILVERDVKLLMTSRKEQELVDGLKDVIEITINLNGCGVDGDISLHVQKRLESDKRLRKWPHGIKQEIYTALIQGAQGMYKIITLFIY